MEQKRDEFGSVALDKLPDLAISGVGGLSTASAFVIDGIAVGTGMIILAVTVYLLYHRYIVKDFKFFGENKGFQEKVVFKVRKRRHR